MITPDYSHCFKDVAGFVGMRPDEFAKALNDPKTCPLCIEVGDEDHDPKGCYDWLEVQWDKFAFQTNELF